MSDTNTCPKCGADVELIKCQETASSLAFCTQCRWTSDKEGWAHEFLPAALHRIRELERESRNARELHRAITEMTKRTDPALEQPDMTDLGQDVAFVVMMHWQMRRARQVLERESEKMREALNEIYQFTNEPDVEKMAQEALKL